MRRSTALECVNRIQNLGGKARVVLTPGGVEKVDGWGGGPWEKKRRGRENQKWTGGGTSEISEKWQKRLRISEVRKRIQQQGKTEAKGDRKT